MNVARGMWFASIESGTYYPGQDVSLYWMTNRQSIKRLRSIYIFNSITNADQERQSYCNEQIIYSDSASILKYCVKSK